MFKNMYSKNSCGVRRFFKSSKSNNSFFFAGISCVSRNIYSYSSVFITLNIGLTHGWGELAIQVEQRITYTQEELNCNKTFAGDHDDDGTVYSARVCSPLTFSGVPANRSYDTSANRIEERSYSLIIFNYQDRGWRISYPNTDYTGSHDPIYDQILSTFKFL